jgi:hypothetical protein
MSRSSCSPTIHFRRLQRSTWPRDRFVSRLSLCVYETAIAYCLHDSAHDVTFDVCDGNALTVSDRHGFVVRVSAIQAGLGILPYAVGACWEVLQRERCGCAVSLAGRGAYGTSAGVCGGVVWSVEPRVVAGRGSVGALRGGGSVWYYTHVTFVARHARLFARLDWRPRGLVESPRSFVGPYVSVSHSPPQCW